MVQFCRVFLLLVLLISSVGISTANEHGSKIDKMMEAAKLNIQMFSAVRNSFVALPVPTNKLEGERLERFETEFRNSAKTSFDPQVLMSFVRNHLVEVYSVDDAEAITRFYESLVGIRIGFVEDAANSPEIQTAIIANSAEIFAKLNENETRKATLQRMVASINAIEQLMQTNQAIILGMLNGMIASGSLPNTLPESQLDQIAQQQMAAMEEQVSVTVLASFYTAYSSISDDDLDVYATFLASAPSKRLYEAYSASYREILKIEMENFGNRLFKALGMERT